MPKSWKRLAIDTATDYVYLSLIENDREKENIIKSGNHDHSVTTIPLMAELLERNGWKLNELDEIIVGIGPGSYTGVRIGVTIAKMIGYLNHIKVSAVSSLALLASGSEAKIIVPLIDARRQNAFIAAFKQNNGKLEYMKPDCLANKEEFLDGMKPMDYEVVDSGKYNIEKIITSGLLISIENIHELVPNYLQMTEAERNIQQ
ncbi:MAG TPA: tRNA (adenosine(37)-N6)-threonylcarbamoyltransferase complex dimerization subunit type 1 TsaB [Bacillota bacterium]|nr:tRNA (adenosine(37)-N6)-threonylcarbamoyltransferase complex dimerization subunit type 1 TsaB [Bacillota bacterium]